jgi:hypothetical protein
LKYNYHLFIKYFIKNTFATYFTQRQFRWIHKQQKAIYPGGIRTHDLVIRWLLQWPAFIRFSISCPFCFLSWQFWKLQKLAKFFSYFLQSKIYWLILHKNCMSDLFANSSGVNVMIINSSNFWQFSANKLAFFSKTNVMIKFFE